MTYQTRTSRRFAFGTGASASFHATIRTSVGLAAATVLLAGLAVACAPRFNGRVEFLNRSNVEVWVEDVDGPYTVAPGILVIGAAKLASMGKREVPQHATIRWWYYAEGESHPHVSHLDLTPFVRARRHGTLTFEFTAQRRWVARMGDQ